ncbi:hypothetical protein ACIBSW_22065 [Actinoplanes sp. NPDC049668]|uniref:hypothetical protein n=1 Tax=unclassified Actinoplanes TaxID=2626549 RepID=UPI00339E4079
MRSVDIITAARAEALFTSELPTGSDPTPADAERAIRDAVRVHGGVRGCAAQMAYGFGDNPEAAAQRMRWARSVVAANYPRRRRSGPRRARGPLVAAFLPETQVA